MTWVPGAELRLPGAGILSHVLGRLRRRSLSALTRAKPIDLSQLDRVPERLSWPLHRDGVDPLPRLGDLRDAEPVHRLASFLGLRIWLVTGPDEVRSALANQTDFSNDIRPFVGTVGSGGEGEVGGLGFTDPPEHTRLRHLLTPQFTMRRLERLRPRIEAIVARQLDEMAAAGPEVDLVQTFAFPVPFYVICELLGLPDEDRETFRELGSARFDVSTGGKGVFGAVSESRSFLMEATSRQRANPRDGLIGDIIRAQGDAISDLDLAGLADGAFTGGLETSASMLALGTAVLLDHPEDYRALVTDPDTVDPTVEELLRYLSVVQIAFPRFAKRDLELGGRRIAEGDVVVCHLLGANHGGDNPGEYDAARTPAPHVAFGYGFHRCVGAELGRMELRVSYAALAKRFPDLRLAVPRDELEFRQQSIVFGLEELPVRLS